MWARFRDRPAVGERHALQGGRKVETDDGRGIGSREGGEFFQRGGADGMVLAEELDGPAANVRLWVIEQREQAIGGEIFGDVQRPEGAEFLRGGARLGGCRAQVRNPLHH